MNRKKHDCYFLLLRPGFCCSTKPVFVFCRVLTGVGVGAMVPVADSLLLEWSPTQWRSKLVMTMIGTAFAVGSIIACGAGMLLHETMGGGEGSTWWRVLLFVCTVPGLISLPCMWFALPASVHFLMTNGRHEEAHLYSKVTMIRCVHFAVRGIYL